jgi:hypothetical protein
MRTIEFASGQIVDDGSYPPRMVFVGYWNKVGTIVMAEGEEGLSDMMRTAREIIKSRSLANRREVDKRTKKML